MHEFSIAQNMMEILERYIKERNAKRITYVKLKIGKLSGAEPELLRSAFDILKEQTPAQDAYIELEVIPVKVRCKDCDVIFESEDFVFICPECGSLNCETIEGEELILEKIGLEV